MERPRASSDFRSRYQFLYTDEQPDHQAHTDPPVRPASRSAPMSSHFVNPDRGRNQPRNSRSLLFSAEPQRNERIANPRQDPVRHWVETGRFNTGVLDSLQLCATRRRISNFSTASLRTDLMSLTQSVLSVETGNSGNASSAELQSISGSWATEKFSVNAWSGRDSFAPSPNISDGDSGHDSGDDGGQAAYLSFSE
ncbi:uncharacterized protein LOC144432137 isoform X2 [Styela clava]